MMHLRAPVALFLLLITVGCSQPEESSNEADPMTAESVAAELQELESELNEVEAKLAQAEADMAESAESAAADISRSVEDMAQDVEKSAHELVEQVGESIDPGKAYLHINAQKPNVKVTESGLQFVILESGDGKSPELTSRVVTHYKGSFIDGKVFDSSIDRGTPAEFPVNRVIAGWTEALQMMKEGDRWRLVIPSDLAYGERGAGGGRIPPNSVLVFEIELIEVK